jgi:hypothetical protein
VEIVAAVAIGLNPYIGAFILAALAAFTGRVPQTDVLNATPNLVLIGLAALAGLVAPVDFVLGKFVRFAPRLRRASQAVAPVAGGLAAAALARPELPLPLIAAGGAALSWGVAAMITTLAARGSRSQAWVGLGHVPILMAAATAAACIVPLSLANTVAGLVLALGALSLLLLATTFGELRDRRAGRVSGGHSQRRSQRVEVRANV